jgi:hypothetical protein
MEGKVTDKDDEIIRLLKDIKSGIGWACLWLFFLMYAVCATVANRGFK